MPSCVEHEKSFITSGPDLHEKMCCRCYANGHDNNPGLSPDVSASGILYCNK